MILCANNRSSAHRSHREYININNLLVCLGQNAFALFGQEDEVGEHAHPSVSIVRVGREQVQVLVVVVVDDHKCRVIHALRVVLLFLLVERARAAAAAASYAATCAAAATAGAHALAQLVGLETVRGAAAVDLVDARESVGFLLLAELFGTRHDAVGVEIEAIEAIVELLLECLHLAQRHARFE